MEEQIKKMKEIAKERIANASDLQMLNDIRVNYLGKKGELTAF